MRFAEQVARIIVANALRQVILGEPPFMENHDKEGNS